MQGTTFKKDTNAITIGKVYLQNEKYFCDLSFSKNGRSGIANGQSLSILAQKLFKEKFVIISDATSQEKINIWNSLIYLVK